MDQQSSFDRATVQPVSAPSGTAPESASAAPTAQHILLNPGPVNVSQSVRQALCESPDISHRQDEFTVLLEEVKAGILNVARLSPDDYEVFVLASSGTGAMEAGLATFVDNALVLDQGVYGDRMLQILDMLGRRARGSREGDVWNDLQRSTPLRATPEWLCFVHNETTLGRMNDWDLVERARAEAPDTRILVDAISSFGAVDVDWSQVDVILGVANKCLHAIAGASFVIAKRELFKGSLPGTGAFYFDLRRYKDGTLPFTMPPQVLYALKQALLESTDVAAREQRYRRLSELIWDEAERVGLQSVIGREQSGHIIASFYLPSGVSYERLYAEMEARGFIIYSGQGELQGKIFRVSNMGELLDEDAVRRFFAGISELTAAPDLTASV
jgi:2-aminoethylphosphonate-pyruvate transaminase